MVISMLKIRRPLGRLIFNMGIAIPGKTVFLIETAPRSTISYDVTWLHSFNVLAHEYNDGISKNQFYLGIISQPVGCELYVIAWFVV